MWIAVDSGNTRIKWAIINNDKIESIQHTPKTNITPLIKASQTAEMVCIAHVGTANEKRQLQQQFSTTITTTTQLLFLKSDKQTLGLINHYQPASSLGVDRWLCLLAAQQYALPVIIVSAGTALTVDWLSKDNTYHGGIILPGLRLMHSSLSSATPLSFNDIEVKKLTQFNNTKDAINTGILMAVCGAVEKFTQMHDKPAQLIITGGDGETLVSYFPTATLVPDLIFQGFLRLKKNELL